MTKTHVDVDDDDDDDDDDAILRLGINPPIISNALISGANMDHEFWQLQSFVSFLRGAHAS